MATILTVTANPLLDHVSRSALLPGQVNRIDRFSVVAGGKGINVGRVLARHGHRVLAAGFAGGISGALLRQLVTADGMEPLLVDTAASTRQGFLCLHPAGGATALLEGGFAVATAEVGALLEAVRAHLPGCDLCIISGSVPDPTCGGLYRLILDACHLAGVPGWLDAYGPAMDEALGGAHPPSLVKPNRQEYEGDSRRWLAAPELHLTDGPAEIRIRHPQGRFRATPPALPQANPIGSGDCYLAGLAHARLAGWPLLEQIRYATAAGAANAASGQVARITPTEITAQLPAVSIRPASD